jgi:LEA14-like dessication related protein
MLKSRLLVSLLLILAISGCATLNQRDSPDVRIIGLEPLPSEGLELRFALKMRVLNPNDKAIVFDGLAVKLDLDGQGLASGVSDATGEIPRFGEQVLTLPVSISAFSAFRQFLARISDGQSEGGVTDITRPIRYSLSGRLGGSGVGSSALFEDSGELSLFSSTTDQDENQNDTDSR